MDERRAEARTAYAVLCAPESETVKFSTESITVSDESAARQATTITIVMRERRVFEHYLNLFLFRLLEADLAPLYGVFTFVKVVVKFP